MFFDRTWRPALVRVSAIVVAATIFIGTWFVIRQEQETRRRKSQQQTYSLAALSEIDAPPPPEELEKAPASKDFDKEIGGAIKIINTLPRSEEEIAQAFERAKSSQCEILTPNQPLEITTFTPYLTDRKPSSASPPIPGLRRSAFAVALELSAEERSRLPLLSRNQILQYLQDHYVSIQVKVQRDQLTGVRYLHHRTFAAAAKFQGARLTQRAEAAVASSIHNFRSLGLLVAADESPTSDNLRTLVLVHKHQHAEQREDGSLHLRPNYEFVFIHARASDSQGVEPLLLHTFVTSGGRSRLHYLQSRAPSHPGTCAVRADVQLTDFTYGGVYPTQAIVRAVMIKDTAVFSNEQLNDYTSSQGWSGDAWDHLPKIVNAIIERKLITASP